MEITNVRLVKTGALLNESKLRGYASITIDDSFVVNDIAVIEGEKGLFLSFPSRKKKNGERVNSAFPCTSDAREKITEEILKVYNNKTA